MNRQTEDLKSLWCGSAREVICPRCQKPMQLTCRWRPRGALVGALGGAAMAFNGARAGARAGSCFLPGWGTLAGMATGALVGALTGAAIGEVVDRDIIANYKCHACGCVCRLNE